MKTHGIVLILCLVLASVLCIVLATVPGAVESSTITAEDIINAPGGTRENPVHISLDGYDLGSMQQEGSGWFSLLMALEIAGKYVTLDLSGCKMIGTVFDHRYDSVGKDKIISLVLPDAATSITGGTVYIRPTFINAAGVSGVNIHTFENNAFHSWSELASIDFPNAVAIGNNAFVNCTGLALESLPPGIRYIGSSAFIGCENLALKSLPAEITYIGPYAFEGCENLALTSLPEKLTSVNMLSFKGCTSLALDTLPPKLESIGQGAFNGCTGLTQITLPETLLSLGAFAFRDCVNLSKVICTALEPPKPYFFSASRNDLLMWEPFEKTHANLEIKVPYESVRAYKRVDGWWEYADRISVIETF